MEIEQQSEQETNQSKNMSAPYLVITFGAGIFLVSCLIYAGVKGYSFLLSILLGGIAQVLFRVSKRMWLNSLNPVINTSRNKNLLVTGIIETMPTVKVFGLLYLAMIAVSALWYGIGMFFAWVF